MLQLLLVVRLLPLLLAGGRVTQCSRNLLPLLRQLLLLLRLLLLQLLCCCKSTMCAFCSCSICCSCLQNDHVRILLLLLGCGASFLAHFWGVFLRIPLGRIKFWDVHIRNI